MGLLLASPITSTVKGYPFEVPVPIGLAVSGVVLADQVRSLDWRALNAEFASSLPDDAIDEILARLDVLLARE